MIRSHISTPETLRVTQPTSVTMVGVEAFKLFILQNSPPLGCVCGLCAVCGIGL